MKSTGKVKWFNEARGYGFIIDNINQNELFVHYTDILGKGFKTLKENQLVEFDISQSDQGKKATNVQII